MKKCILILSILVFIFLILEISKNMWVERKIILLKNKMNKTSFVWESSVDDLFEKLQRIASRNSTVWSLRSQYYFRRMTRALRDQERLFFAQKSLYFSVRALECNPLDQSLRALYHKAYRWWDVLSNTIP